MLSDLLERSRITVEEVKPLLPDKVQFHNGNCAIRFPDEDDDDDVPFSHASDQPSIGPSKSIIRTVNMSPGAIVSSMLEKYDSKPGGCL